MMPATHTEHAKPKKAYPSSIISIGKLLADTTQSVPQDTNRDENIQQVVGYLNRYIPHELYNTNYEVQWAPYSVCPRDALCLRVKTPLNRFWKECAVAAIEWTGNRIASLVPLDNVSQKTVMDLVQDTRTNTIWARR